MPTVILATRNTGKVRELAALLAPYAIDVRSLADYPQTAEVEETGETFAANALLKAQAVAKATGLVAVADDSGLEVDALAGAPGVHSARYAGVHGDDAANNAKLLRALDGLTPEERGCRFVSVVVASAPDGRHILARGEWPGLVAAAPRGSGGFGYDPLFFDPTVGRTAAELSPEEKNARSHRGQALRRLLAQWPDFWDKTRHCPAK